MVGIEAIWDFELKDKNTGKILKKYTKHNDLSTIGLQWMLSRMFGKVAVTGAAITGVDAVRAIEAFQPVIRMVLGGGTTDGASTPVLDVSRTSISESLLAHTDITANVSKTTVASNVAKIVVSGTFDLNDIQSQRGGESNTEYFATEAALYTTLPDGAAPHAPQSTGIMHSRIVLTQFRITQDTVLTVTITETVTN